MEITGSGSGSGGSALTVTDGVTPVVNVKTLNFTSGATVTNGGGGQANVVISSVTVETPAGTVDGSNTIFTTANTPKWIAVDGIMKFLTLNYTYAANTITITDGAPPVFSIRNFF